MNPYQKSSKAYKAASVTTQDQGTLILMLYDGGIRFCKTALLKLQKKDLEGVHMNLIKAKNIVSELLSSLNSEQAGEVGRNLQQLYVYIFNKLIDSNIQKDEESISEVIQLMIEMREGWQFAIGQNKQSTQQGRFDQKGQVKSLDING